MKKVYLEVRLPPEGDILLISETDMPKYLDKKHYVLLSEFDITRNYFNENPEAFGEIQKANVPPPDDRAERLRIAKEMFAVWFAGDPALPKGDTVESYAKKGADWAFMCADVLLAKSKSIDEAGKV